MLSQGSVEQSSFASGYRCSSTTNSGRVLGTNTENRLRMVKKYQHNTLSLHGVGKNVAKGDASRVIHRLVIEEIIVEDLKKNDLYDLYHQF
ncbi:hypothetical protein L6452_22674 [Arctium lappa]|uniref:Uncharacterized protein n=1 Tax=Arctium lappa TaxID=4217 RepID=A0ACB9B186_ARCLA|nr:hypothetical protein L6452_22674 [Arctium lappa]